jgi:hypothetical protein
VRPANVPPLQTYFVDYDDKFADADARGHMGDVAIWRICGGSSNPVFVPVLPPPVGFIELGGCRPGDFRDREGRCCDRREVRRGRCDCPPNHIRTPNGQCCDPREIRDGRCCDPREVREGRCCPPDHIRTPDGRCCDPREVRNGKCCDPREAREGRCCPPGQIMENGQCCTPSPASGQCGQPPCPRGEIKLPNGQCCDPRFVHDGRCLPPPPCPRGQVMAGGVCCDPQNVRDGQCSPPVPRRLHDFVPPHRRHVIDHVPPRRIRTIPPRWHQGPINPGRTPGRVFIPRGFGGGGGNHGGRGFR